VKQEATSLGVTTVEAKRKFVEAVIETLMLNTTLERTEQPPLQQRCDFVDARHNLVGLFEAGAEHCDALAIACVGRSRPA